VMIFFRKVIRRGAAEGEFAPSTSTSFVIGDLLCALPG
jgi:hypothetical protein